MIAAKCSYAVYLARECVHWDSKQTLSQLSNDVETKSDVSEVVSISEKQLERIQENTTKALIIHAN